MTKNLPRILHIVPHDGIGGVEVAARSMLGRDSLGCKFSLLLIAGSAQQSHPDIILSKSRSPSSPWAQIKAVRAALKYDGDVLICSLWRSVPVALAVKWLRPRTRLVYFLHLEKTVHFADAICSRLAICWADEIWADSDATLSARNIPRSKPCRIISFVTDRIEPAAGRELSPAPTFVTWARLNHQKGIDQAIDFIAALVEAGINATFDIWGPDGGELHKLVEHAKARGIEDRVRFCGPARREDLPAIAAQHRFFLQLSRYEGMAMGVVEAMQLGLVPVTTSVGQMGTYVQPAKTGILIDPTDLKRAVDSFKNVLRSEAAYQTLRSNAVGIWDDHPLYAEDVCRAAQDLAATAGN